MTPERVRKIQDEGNSKNIWPRFFKTLKPLKRWGWEGWRLFQIKRGSREKPGGVLLIGSWFFKKIAIKDISETTGGNEYGLGHR